MRENKADIYVRSNTNEVNKQLAECELTAKRLGIAVNRVCVDGGKSAHDDNRAGYQQLIADIKMKRITIVFVKEFQSFHRDTLKLIEFMKIVELHQVKIFLIDENKFYTDNLSDVKTLRAFAFNESQKWLK